MSRIWTWYGKRRWWAKALIAAPVLLALAAGLYLLARFFQYKGSSATAGEFAPAGAQIVVRCVDGAGHWARFQKSDAGRTILQKILKDPDVRKSLNAQMEERRTRLDRMFRRARIPYGQVRTDRDYMPVLEKLLRLLFPCLNTSELTG